MNSQQTSPPVELGPGPIMGIVVGHWQAKILLTAMKSDVFTALSGTSATAAELAARLGYRLPGANDFLLALAGMGLLETHGPTFTNTPLADRHLVRGEPGFIGGYLQFCERELNPAWDGLDVALRTGEPNNAAALDGNPYHALYSDADGTDSFLVSMDLLNATMASRLGHLDWSRYGSFVDVGGARGSVAHQVVGEHPHLTATVFDLPPLERAFEARMAELGGAGSVSFHGGDFFADPLPEADVLVFGHVLHNWGTAHRLELLRNAYKAVRPGGAVVVYDPMVSDEKPPLNAVLAALSMLVWSSGGGEYSIEECRTWLLETGFRPEVVESANSQDDVMIIGHKDA